MIEFISPRDYRWIYYVCISLLIFYQMIQYAQHCDLNLNEDAIMHRRKESIVLTVILILFIGLRPVSGIFIDMMNYKLMFDYIPISEVFDTEQNNMLFNAIMVWYKLNNYDIVWFFFTIAVIYFVGILYGILKLFPKDSFYAFLIYLGALSTFDYGTNGIKAGAAASLFLVALTYYRRLSFFLLFSLISIMFHHSMAVVLLAAIICRYVRKPKIYIAFWTVCLLLALLHITFFQHFFSGFSEKAYGYLTAAEDAWGGKKGFRIDFILYGCIPIVVGYIYLIKRKYEDEFYSFLYSLYLLLNGLWMLCMYVPYNNRIAYLSWALIPVVSIYPYLRLRTDAERFKPLNNIVAVYTLFSLFATFFL